MSGRTAPKELLKEKMKKGKEKKPKLWENIRQMFTLQRAYAFLFHPSYLFVMSCLLILIEVLICVFVVERVKYTEIDWSTYMQQVGLFLNGTYDYSEIRGDTGPLVYPAGFLYIYSLFYALTDAGANVRLAQYVFIVIYIAFITLVLRLYWKSKKVPPYVLALMCLTTYRIHSIFLLRLFNDPIAILLTLASLNLFLDGRWSLGSLFFSLAVSVKMNVLLYAPGLLLAYIYCLSWRRTLVQLFICGFVQILLGLPFLLTNPVSYMKGAFNLGRVFEYKWTVNWRFLPEDLFLNPYFHVTLLALHLLTLFIFYDIATKFLWSYGRLKTVEQDIRPQISQHNETLDTTRGWQLFLLPLFLSNFIGIVFSRSLHYQFYVWYYHTLPYLLWSTSLTIKWRLCLLGIIEMCWNTYPSTDLSSAALQLAHYAILYKLYRYNKIIIKSNQE